MELKQMEFFIAATECKSLSKAAGKLYTSQPNVSKVIRNLERELGLTLFLRTSKGLELTDEGRMVYEYAINITKNFKMIQAIPGIVKKKIFTVSTYQSNFLAKIMTQLYKKYPAIEIAHRSGNVEDITNQVEKGIAELGVLFVFRQQSVAFENMLRQKNLKFRELGRRQACIYAGVHAPIYEKEEISLTDLKQLKFVSDYQDYFAMKDGMERDSAGVVNAGEICTAIATNSEHFTMNLLMQTELVCLGIDLDFSEDRSDLKKIRIAGEDASLCLGIVIRENHVLSEYAMEMVEMLREILES